MGSVIVIWDTRTGHGTAMSGDDPGDRIAADQRPGVAFVADESIAVVLNVDCGPKAPAAMTLWDVKSGVQIDLIVVDGEPRSLAVQGDLVFVGNGNSTVTVYRVR